MQPQPSGRSRSPRRRSARRSRGPSEADRDRRIGQPRLGGTPCCRRPGRVPRGGTHRARRNPIGLAIGISTHFNIHAGRPRDTSATRALGHDGLGCESKSRHRGPEASFTRSSSSMKTRCAPLRKFPVAGVRHPGLLRGPTAGHFRDAPRRKPRNAPRIVRRIVVHHDVPHSCGGRSCRTMDSSAASSGAGTVVGRITSDRRPSQVNVAINPQKRYICPPDYKTNTDHAETKCAHAPAGPRGTAIVATHVSRRRASRERCAADATATTYRIVLEAAIPALATCTTWDPRRAGPTPRRSPSRPGEGRHVLRKAASSSLRTTPHRHFLTKTVRHGDRFHPERRRFRPAGETRGSAGRPSRRRLAWMICRRYELPARPTRLNRRSRFQRVRRPETRGARARQTSGHGAPRARDGPSAALAAIDSGNGARTPRARLRVALIIEAILLARLCRAADPCVFPDGPDDRPRSFMKGSGSPALGRLAPACTGSSSWPSTRCPIAAVISITRLVGGDAVTADISLTGWPRTGSLEHPLFFLVLQWLRRLVPFGAFEITMPCVDGHTDAKADSKGAGRHLLHGPDARAGVVLVHRPIVAPVLDQSPPAASSGVPSMTVLAFPVVLRNSAASPSFAFFRDAQEAAQERRMAPPR